MRSNLSGRACNRNDQRKAKLIRDVTVTALETVFRPVRRTPSALRSAGLPLMTRAVSGTHGGKKSCFPHADRHRPRSRNLQDARKHRPHDHMPPRLHLTTQRFRTLLHLSPWRADYPSGRFRSISSRSAPVGFDGAEASHCGLHRLHTETSHLISSTDM